MVRTIKAFPTSAQAGKYLYTQHRKNLFLLFGLLVMGVAGVPGFMLGLTVILYILWWLRQWQAYYEALTMCRAHGEQVFCWLLSDLAIIAAAFGLRDRALWELGTAMAIGLTALWVRYNSRRTPGVRWYNQYEPIIDPAVTDEGAVD